MTIEIPDNLISTLKCSLNQQAMTLKIVINMTEEEMIENLAKMEQFDFIRKALESKTAHELTQELEIKELLNQNRRGVEVMFDEANEIIKLLELQENK